MFEADLAMKQEMCVGYPDISVVHILKADPLLYTIFKLHIIYKFY